ncbi:efflux RND transporter periplasmic adaptor subunit [Rhizobium sp. AC44/96]|uniref:efflux RND transporter periplasmic adaptor subunit n=1 Tax=Rhizobium sp. AC44/96 TaxID=1841654 RepID=UPI001FCCF59A|nr:efflux RND transporter periplasmic adaptor subunit [Rhizobium sp. AC44/96]
MKKADFRLAVLPLLASVALAGCNDSKTAAQPPVVKPQVSVVSMHPKSVTITAQLPGRTAASLVAEVRPQVGGIIRTRNFKEGTEVKAGEILYEIDPAPYQATYDSAAAALQKAQGALPSAQAKVDRYKNLTAQNAVSVQDLDDAKSTLVQAEADIASAKAALETARINLDYTKIRAPIDGRIDASAVTVGALVTAEQTTVLTTVRALDPINVNVTQSSTNLLKFRKTVETGKLKLTGDDVSAHLTLEDGSNYGRTGKLEFAEASVDESVGTFTVRAEFPNPDHTLLPGMYVRATIEEGVAEKSFLIPQRAITRDTKGDPTALFVTSEGKIEQRVLGVDRSVGNNWLVLSGVNDGDKVVVEGSQRVQVGQGVAAKEVTIDDSTGDIMTSQAEPEPTKQASAASHSQL